MWGSNLVKKKDAFVSAYPTIASKLWRRLRDIPWRLSEARDTCFPGEFAQLHNLVRPYTMCTYARLRGLCRAVQYVVTNNIPGDIVECGAARGGSAALMGLTLKKLEANRILWIFDTFEGLPPPTSADPDYEVAKQYTGSCRGELHEVENLFSRFEILRSVKFIKGLFQVTIPTSSLERIAVLHIDADWYESVKVCLDHLYARVSSGGVIQIDDYGDWAGARRATLEFLHMHRIAPRLHYLDYTGRQFIKP